MNSSLVLRYIIINVSSQKEFNPSGKAVFLILLKTSWLHWATIITVVYSGHFLMMQWCIRGLEVGSGGSTAPSPIPFLEFAEVTDKHGKVIKSY